MYTSHGHHIEGTLKLDDVPNFVMRCGGPSLCVQCTKEAYQALLDKHEMCFKEEDPREVFRRALARVLNTYGIDAEMGVPDHKLAVFLDDILHRQLQLMNIFSENLDRAVEGYYTPPGRMETK